MIQPFVMFKSASGLRVKREQRMDTCDQVKEMWQAYLATLPPGSEQPQIYITWNFTNEREAANRLGILARDGIKTATASLLWEFEENGEDLPLPGDMSIITDWEGVPLCIIETTTVEVRPFDQVDAGHAYLEGEGDRTLDYWRRVHWGSFTQACGALDREPSENMPVVCERFRVVFPVDEFRKQNV
jgi:uncharacterized protein YhfF